MPSKGQGHIIYLFYVPERPTKAERSTGERGTECRTERKMREMESVRLNGGQITKNRLLFERRGKHVGLLLHSISPPIYPAEENTCVKKTNNFATINALNQQ